MLAVSAAIGFLVRCVGTCLALTGLLKSPWTAGAGDVLRIRPPPGAS
ncbi:hypothetical protein [Streptomyces noursei]|nr:hypothetical protein [Streptomyces noursei]